MIPPHIHCPACSFPIEVVEDKEVATPAARCPRCGRSLDAYTWKRLNEVMFKLGLPV